jgi:hypothetical protein
MGGKGERSDQLRLMALRSALDRAALAEAASLVERWNEQLAAKRAPQFSPTIGCAINAGRPWLRLHCPGCRQVYEVDLRRIVRPRGFPITALRLACESGCRRQAPPPELIGLFAAPEQTRTIAGTQS